MNYLLTSAGSDPLAVMAALRSCYRMSLSEARSLISNLPAPLPAAADMAAVAARLRQAGATVGEPAKPKAAPAPKPAIAPKPKPVPVTNPAAAITKITVTAPGPKAMQIIPLLKKELKYNYGKAAAIAEKGGEISGFPDSGTARRIADALRALGASFTAE